MSSVPLTFDPNQFIQVIQKYFLSPLEDLPTGSIRLLDTNHDQCVQDFENAVAPLFDPAGSQFQGQGANAVADCFQSYLTAKGALSTYESYGLTDRITTLLRKCATASTDEESAIQALRDSEFPWEKWNTDPNAGKIASTAGGPSAPTEAPPSTEPPVPPPEVWPIVLPLLPLIGGAVMLYIVGGDINQQIKANNAIDVINTWVNDMKNLALQPDPKGSELPGPPAQQIDTGASYDAGQLVANALGTSLSPDQEKLAEQLANDYGLPIEDIVDIMVKNPNLTEAQLRALLNEYTNVINANPNLVKEHGALAVFEEFIALAAYDPAHGGDYAKKKPSVEKQLSKGIEEATVELGAMEEDKIPWPLTPSTDPAYEGTDPTGQRWDVKSPQSATPDGRTFDANREANGMKKDFDKGEKVIIDDRNITPEERQELYNELKTRGQDGKVVWWPDNPTVTP